VILDHPKGNRINLDMQVELLDAFERVAARTETKEAFYEYENEGGADQ
jgi:hypothetical protein